MLSIDQYNQIMQSSDVVDKLHDEIDLDDDHQYEISCDPGELHQLLETWSFMFNALASLGYFRTVRMETGR